MAEESNGSGRRSLEQRTATLEAQFEGIEEWLKSIDRHIERLNTAISEGQRPQWAVIVKGAGVVLVAMSMVLTPIIGYLHVGLDSERTERTRYDADHARTMARLNDKLDREVSELLDDLHAHALLPGHGVALARLDDLEGDLAHLDTTLQREMRDLTRASQELTLSQVNALDERLQREMTMQVSSLAAQLSGIRDRLLRVEDRQVSP